MGLATTPVSVPAATGPPVLVCSAGELNDLAYVEITNSGAKTCYLGGPNVTAATGYPLASLAVLGNPIPLGPGDSIYAICATTDTTTLQVFATRQ